jgi:ribonuclease BN (tRNA processing enzyme)
MRLTTIGTGTISLTPGRACAGHHVDAGAARLLLDCGSGVVHRMAERGVDWWGITHVLLTHFHADHVGDLPTLVFAWKWGRFPEVHPPVSIVGPPGTAALLDRLAQGFGPWLLDPGFPLTIRELGGGEFMDLPDGPRLSARKVPHTDESVAYSLEHGGARLVYTGDTGFDETLGAWAHGCGVLLAECSLPAELAVATHLTPEQCGALAAIARPRLLALTHLYPPVEQLDLRGIVGSAFDGDVAIAFDGWTIDF